MVAITTSPSPRIPQPSAGRARLILVDARRSDGVALRRLGLAALALVFALAVGYLIATPAIDTSGAVPVQDAVHVVGEGETMWSIASTVAPAGEAAVYVERLVEVNGSATVTPGQVLQLPVP